MNTWTAKYVLKSIHDKILLYFSFFKTLIGTYVCSDIPGEFIWRPGPIYQAAKSGYWLLLEDIDHSTLDLLSLLIDLLEKSYINSNEIYLRISTSFRLFLTKRTKSEKTSNSGYLNSLTKLSRSIKLNALTNDEINEVVK
jgi:midasin